MRDPLRNVPVRYKLVFTFVGVCLLAFGVGGYLVSSTARASLEREILALLRLRSQLHATTLEGELRALNMRTRDFASDGFIRTHFVEGLDGAATSSSLREHIRRNKLPLEPAFRDLALVDSGGRLFLTEPGDGRWVTQLPGDAFGAADWFSGLIASPDEDAPPVLVISTPVSSLSGDRVIGTLLVQVNAGAWISGALASSLDSAVAAQPGLRLRLTDGTGGTLDIPQAWVEGPPAITSQIVQRSQELRVRAEPERRKAGVGAVLSQSFPIALNGWALETKLDTRDALAAVSGLQARFLLVGLTLTAAASLILLFPMRFLARPIRQLHEAAIHIREGDFGARVPVESSDEIGELSRSFNLMAEAVEERTEKLRAAARSLDLRGNELRKERDRLNAVIHSMRDALIVLDADGGPDVWNAAAEPLIEVVRRGGLELNAHRNCHQAAGENGNESACVECLFEPAAPPRSCLIDAGPFVYEVHSTRLASEPDGRSGRVLVAREISDRVVQDEREIHQERLSVLGEVAAVMAHELNNPLAAIKMFSQLMETKLPADSPLREDLSVIERNTQTCTRTIRELLDYATGATPEVGAVDVHANLRDVAGFLRAFRERKDAELVLQLEAEDPVVVGDEVQLRQVFVNLILNALQAVGGGRVTVRSWQDKSHLVVDVTDNGPGIPPEIGDAVFRPFFTTKPRGSGTGLGLSTARRITEIQGGGLELVDGRPGRTTFRVRLLRESS